MDKDFGQSEPIVKAPAIGVSVTCNAGGDRQIVLQTFIDQEADDSAANALADKLMRLADRQQAKYSISGLKEQIAKDEKALEAFERDAAHIIETHAKQAAVFDVQISELESKAEAARVEGYNAHAASGRRGTYEPKGTTKQQITAYETEVARLKAERQKIADEDLQNADGIAKTRKVYAEMIAKNAAKIIEAEALVG